MSENALAVIERITDPVASAQQMGKACALMCRARSEEEGQVIWIHCLMEGITPIQFMRRYHLIDGKPTMRADAMLGEWRMQGGKHRVVESTPERAAIELVDRDGVASSFELSWDECEQSRWPWKDHRDHDKGFKDNWSTPLDRKNMLWARLISDSLRKVAPELVAGIYTPEEIGDAVDGDTAVKLPPATRTASQVLEEVAAHKASQQQQREADGGPVDVPFDVVSEELVDEGAKKQCSKSQREKIQQLYEALGIPQQSRDDALRRRGVGSLQSLSRDQAQEIIDKLVARQAQLGNS